MWLALDTTVIDTVRIGIERPAGWAWETLPRLPAVAVLAVLVSFLERQALSLADLTGLIVKVGSGTFSGTRTGVTIANILGLANNLAVAGAEDFSVPALAAAKSGARPGHFIAARYSAPPRLGGK